jgi:thioesterase domain-containing protein
MGGLIAMEMALQLRAAGETVAALVLIDSHLLQQPSNDRPPAMRDFLIDFAHEYGLPMTPADFAMRRRDRIKRAFDLARSHAVVPADLPLDEFRAIYHRHVTVFRRNVRAGRRYQPAETPPEFLFLRPEEATLVITAGPTRNWRTIAPQMVSGTVTGNHFTLLQPPHVESVARQITRYLKAVAEETRPNLVFPRGARDSRTAAPIARRRRSETRAIRRRPLP